MADQPNGFTTNADDLAKAAALKSRLAQQNTTTTTASSTERISSVEVASGIHKYVLIRAQIDGEEQYVVTSRQGAEYHRDAAEPMIEKLERAGYSDIEITGGGRIDCNDAQKSMKIYGFSYGFGLADHATSQRTVQEDPRYRDFDITISNEGY